MKAQVKVFLKDGSQVAEFNYGSKEAILEQFFKDLFSLFGMEWNELHCQIKKTEDLGETKELPVSGE